MRVGVPRPFRRRPSRPRDGERRRRGIYILPTLFTVANLFFGFWALIDAINGRFHHGAWLVLIAGMLDGLDGRIARLTNTTSEFGKEYDSLADLVSFGIAPAILAYQWGLHDMGRWGIAVSFLFAVAGSVRLARFNVTTATCDRRFFTGLAIPGGAGALALMVLWRPQPVLDQHLKIIVSVYLLLLAALMVSQIPYRSFKDFNLTRRYPARSFFAIAVIVTAVIFWTVPVMSLMAACYLVSGPLELVIRKISDHPIQPLPPPPEVPRGSTQADHS